MTLLALALAACGTASASGTTTSTTTNPGNNPNVYGGTPSWLPRASNSVHAVKVTSWKNPQLGFEGDTFVAQLPNGTARVTLTGPLVPPFVAPPPPTTTCTFTFTMHAISGHVPLSAGDIEFIDGAGVIHHPAFVGPVPPADAPLGQTLVFRVQAAGVTTGPGAIRWGPNHQTVATWDFTVEVD